MIKFEKIDSEEIIEEIRDKINKPKFVSKIEVARLAIKEYEKVMIPYTLAFIETLNINIKSQEKELQQRYTKKDTERFNEGYNQAIKDYDIFPKKKDVKGQLNATEKSE